MVRLVVDSEREFEERSQFDAVTVTEQLVEPGGGDEGFASALGAERREMVRLIRRRVAVGGQRRGQMFCVADVTQRGGQVIHGVRAQVPHGGPSLP